MKDQDGGGLKKLTWQKYSGNEGMNNRTARQTDKLSFYY